MKKIGAILFIGLLIVGGYTGYRYYADTYKGEKAHGLRTDRQKSATFGTECLHRSNH
ncbi:hypothetical protein [Enterococcus faecalis]|uniref:hypothetical protein n=1 Tax=Enterococcus faecalis TaxID=1351 RepID=UPI003F8E0C94